MTAYIVNTKTGNVSWGQLIEDVNQMLLCPEGFLLGLCQNPSPVSNSSLTFLLTVHFADGTL